jgi:hypothetical protein
VKRDLDLVPEKRLRDLRVGHAVGGCRASLLDGAVHLLDDPRVQLEIAVHRERETILGQERVVGLFAERLENAAAVALERLAHGFAHDEAGQQTDEVGRLLLPAPFGPRRTVRGANSTVQSRKDL